MAYVLVAFCVLALTSGQVMFKVVSSRIVTLADLRTDTVALAIFAFAASLYAISTLAWVVALRSLPLSQAYLFTAAGFVLVPFAAHFLLGEPLSARVLVGAVLVAAGIWISAS